MAAVPGYARDDYSNVNAEREDQIAAKSEETGKIPASEVEALGGRANILDDSPGIKTRGVKIDAMKQERDIDEAIARSDADDMKSTS